MLRLVAQLALAAVLMTEESIAQDRTAAARERMAAEISAMARETGFETGRPVFAERVMAAIRKVPRHRFVPPAMAGQAYDKAAKLDRNNKTAPIKLNLVKELFSKSGVR